MQAANTLTITPVVPTDAAQGYKLELFEISAPIPPHYHKVQRQMLLVVEGSLDVTCDNQKPVVLKAGELFSIDPGTIHALRPQGTCRFFAIDIPGFNYPDDVYHDQPAVKPKWMGRKEAANCPLDPQYYRERHDAGSYAAYSFFNGDACEKKWSAALLEIHDSPRHYHKKEKECFVVVEGELDVEIDGAHLTLTQGDFVQIFPKAIHKLTSKTKNVCKVLCFNFPAFDINDLYTV